ncbi:hypothetical protein [Pseudomonas asiatica]|uniref:Uncharacterized protein n=1 Tax=Pseudomonas asiatica TaxID=2219225 RepID=A0A9X4HTG4_9PSED|nr:hypothetical protein [Pseudomonas asiatica]MDD2108440.1 hypothetical protein [Pseudomonas asiatica]
MPTENRSSNTEMVSVPREPTREMLNGVCMHPDLARSLWSALLKNAPQPATQSHAEPIAWMVGTAFWWTREEAERDAAATGLPIVGLGPMPALQGEPAWFMTEGGVSAMHAKAKAISDQQGLDTSAYSVPLYTHADPGEVERCEARLHEVASLCASVEQERDTLRVQLAERDALLHEVSISPDWSLSVDLQVRISNALSASAEPSTPIAWHVGGNGYDRICFEMPADLPGHPCIQPIHDQRQLIDLLKRYDLRDEDVPPDERAHGIPGTSFQRLNALANQGE